MKRKDYGILLIIISAVFGFLETHYFGGNWTPQSIAEYICDGLSLSINLFGLYLLITSNKKA